MDPCTSVRGASSKTSRSAATRTGCGAPAHIGGRRKRPVRGGLEQRLRTRRRNTRAPARRPGRRTGLEQGLDGGGDERGVSGLTAMSRRSSTGGRTGPRAGAGPAGQGHVGALVQVVVHGRAARPNGLGDLGDVRRLFPAAGGRVHAADGGGLPSLSWGFRPRRGRGPGSLQALAGALDDQLALELIDRAEDVEDQPPGRRGRVDLLVSTTRPTPRPRSSSASASRRFSDRIPRDSRVMTNMSPSRR